jgi:four helix bundle protein
MDLVTTIYNQTKSFPNTEKFGIVSQIRRSAVSIPSNISEGYGRNSNKDFIRFLNISMGSLFEVQTQAEIAYNLEFMDQEDFEDLFQQSREVERIISSFIRSLNR